MRVTRKGQVTIPLAIRQKLGILPDTEVEFAVRGDAVILRKVGGGSRAARASSGPCGAGRPAA